jgi:uncharacterized protein (DUF2225 family)
MEKDEFQKLKDICPGTYEQVKNKGFVCPHCRQVFQGKEVVLTIKNDTRHDGSPEFKAVQVNGNIYLLTCPHCKSTALHGFGEAYGYFD